MRFAPFIVAVGGVVMVERAWVRAAIVVMFALVQYWLHQRELDRSFNEGYEATIAAFGVAGEQIANLRANQSQAESCQDAIQVLQ